MSRKNLVQALEIVLADSYALYLKTQNYHWNVIGGDFYELHLLLETQYRELIEPIDEIAERLRVLGAHVPGSFKAFGQLQTLEEPLVAVGAEAMVQDLYGDQEKIVKTLHHALKQANQESDAVTADMLIKRLAAHEKNHWMLGATLNRQHSRIKSAA